MAQSFDVCIRGAGVVGRALALLLARDRLRVALVDGSPASGAIALPGAAGASPPQDVRAYALNGASRRLLESLRGWPAGDAVTPVLSMQVQGDGGGAVDFDAGRQEVDALAWIVDVPALESQLAEAVRYQPLVEVVEAPPANAVLTVVCEGKASVTRAEFGVRFDIRPYPQSAVAARLTASQPHGQTARQWFLPDGSILALLPAGGPSGHAVALVWSVARDRATQLLDLPAEEFARSVSECSAMALGALELAGERATWPLQWALADRWTGPMPLPADAPARKSPRSWALAGDAAHTVHPLAGQGLNLGLADAQELATVLQGRDYWRSPADPKLLRRYERARKAAVVPMGLATDGLQQLFAQSDGPWGMLRNWGMRGFDRSGPVKRWVARQAMGLR
jgi:2-polyprenyl-6-methoxyphenol hydroxylase-like FAD-dependent oxidoreductase